METTQKISFYAIPGIKNKDFETNLNGAYTFGNLVKGGFNKMAINSSEFILKDLGKTPYQPLLIFGEPGLGKTHILHAIGNEAIKYNPGLKPFYINANSFKQLYISSIKSGNRYGFMAFYDTIDMLLIDDIESIFGSANCQDAFFHIFNALYQKNKQIVIASSVMPSDFYGIDQKVSSRLKWGLSVEVGLPDLGNRIDILRNKSDLNGLAISDHVLEYIAGNIATNIRELEGALASILAVSVNDKRDIDIELAKDVLKKIHVNTKREISIDYIIKTVCRYFNLPEGAIHLETRKREIVQARQIAMYFSKELTKHHLSEIGGKIGNKDHATVLHACKTVNNLFDTEIKYREQIKELEKMLKNNAR